MTPGQVSRAAGAAGGRLEFLSDFFSASYMVSRPVRAVSKVRVFRKTPKIWCLVH